MHYYGATFQSLHVFFFSSVLPPVLQNCNISSGALACHTDSENEEDRSRKGLGVIVTLGAICERAAFQRTVWWHLMATNMYCASSAVTLENERLLAEDSF